MTFSLLFLFVFFATYFIWLVANLKQAQMDAFDVQNTRAADVFKT